MTENIYRLARAKFKVSEDVTNDDIGNALKGLPGYEVLSIDHGGMISETTVDGKVFTRNVPEPIPEPEIAEEPPE